MDNNIYNCWRDLRFRYTSDNTGNLSDITDGRRRSSLQSLAQRYRRFSNIALVMIPWSILMWVNPSFRIPYKGIIMIIWCIYFAIASGMDRWLYYGIKSIDCAKMPIVEVARKTRLYRRRHLQFIAILLPIAGIIVGAFIYYSDNIYMTASIIVGGILGAAIGYRQLLAFLADYRQLLQDD